MPSAPKVFFNGINFNYNFHKQTTTTKTTTNLLGKISSTTTSQTVSKIKGK
jgi:hypothetical protein